MPFWAREKIDNPPTSCWSGEGLVKDGSDLSDRLDQAFDRFVGGVKQVEGRPYRYLEYLGTVGREKLPDSARCEMVPSSLRCYFTSQFVGWCTDKAGDFVVSNSTKQHLYDSVMKMDRPVVHKYRNRMDILAPSLTNVSEMHDLAFRAPEMTDVQVMEEARLDTSAGVLLAYCGCPKKKDVHRADFITREFQTPNYNRWVIWKVSGKREPKTRHDYVELGKQRTFIIEPYEHQFHSKKVYGNQNKALMGVGWSAYGMNPYDGGVRRMGSRLVRHKRFGMFDGKGWDRIMPFMQEIYVLRNKYKDQSVYLNWVYKNMIESILYLPNGDLVFKTWGNNSGSTNTTGDNILGMEIAFGMVLAYLGVPRREWNKYVDVFIFGDDVVWGDSLPFSDEEVEVAFKHVYTELCGIELDPFVLSQSLEDMEFLGFRFGRDPASGCWIPVYPLSKLCSSFLGGPDSLDPIQEVAKLTSLMLMSAGHGHVVFNFFRNAVLECIECSRDPAIEALRVSSLDNLIPTYDAVMAWYIGYES